MELTIRYIDKIRSAKLALAIGRIACKILNAFKSRFLERVSTIGYSLTEKISEIAVSWGYLEAVNWKHDVSFAKYLGINALNNGAG